MGHPFRAYTVNHHFAISSFGVLVGENCQLKRSQPLFPVVMVLRQPGVIEEDGDSLGSRMSGW